MLTLNRTLDGPQNFVKPTRTIHDAFRLSFKKMCQKTFDNKDVQKSQKSAQRWVDFCDVTNPTSGCRFQQKSIAARNHNTQRFKSKRIAYEFPSLHTHTNSQPIRSAVGKCHTMKTEVCTTIQYGRQKKKKQKKTATDMKKQSSKKQLVTYYEVLLW